MFATSVNSRGTLQGITLRLCAGAVGNWATSKIRVLLRSSRRRINSRTAEHIALFSAAEIEDHGVYIDQRFNIRIVQ